METLGNINKPKTSNIYICKCCDFETSKKNNYTIHIMTAKHQKIQNGNVLETFGNQIKPNSSCSKYLCEKCQKEFKNRSGLWKHKQKCTVQEEKELITQNDTTNKDDLINYLIKENQEFKNLILEIIKKDTYNTTNNTTNNNTNSHNKAFNLNFFLNETCKDAMNIMDFVDSIQLQLSDLENVGKLGYVNGISNIIIKNLKEIDVEKRPVHCTDKKRETMYVKDENKWEKDDGNKKICKAIKKVVSKNQRLIPKFKEAHPDCNTYHSKFSDQYNKLILESCGGSGDNDLEKEEKIIQNISKNVLVDK